MIHPNQSGNRPQLYLKRKTELALTRELSLFQLIVRILLLTSSMFDKLVSLQQLSSPSNLAHVWSTSESEDPFW